MKVIYHDGTRQCSIDGNVSDLDSAARKYSCYFCHGGITVQRCDDGWRLWCPQGCGELHDVASKHAGRSSRIFPVRESAKKSEEDLYGGE